MESPVQHARERGRVRHIRKDVVEVCTLNVRSLTGVARLEELLLATAKIRFDVIGLSEVRRRGQGAQDLPQGQTLYFNGGGHARDGSTGFLVSNKWRKAVHNFLTLTPRISVLDLEFKKSILTRLGPVGMWFP